MSTYPIYPRQYKYLKTLKLFSLVFLFASLSNTCLAGVFPPDHAHLNYRIVGFTFPVVGNATDFAVEIAGGMLLDANTFNGSITASASHTNKVVAEVPSLGSDYTWRALYMKNGVVVAKSELHYFSTSNNPYTDTTVTRLRVMTNNITAPYYLLTDGARTIYDLNGNPVWYLTDEASHNLGTNEMKVTSQGTITMLLGSDAYEIDYNGKQLWKAPTELTSLEDSLNKINYHHEFTKLNNGHYMAFGNPTLKADKNNMYQTHLQKTGERLRFFKSPLQSQLYEYDQSGKLVWKWDASQYYAQSDILALYKENYAKQAIHGHENSFYFDQKNSVIYISFVTFNRIIKISYPSGEILKTYGTIYKAKGHADPTLTKKSPEFALKNEFFNGQHSCKLNANGELYILNNNINDTASFPKISIFKEEEGAKMGGLKKIWEYECKVANKAGPINNGGGGCVEQMPDGNMFVLMNNPYSNAMIISQDKKILWNAQLERKNENNEWSILPSYRTSIVSRAQLEQLIMSSLDENLPIRNPRQNIDNESFSKP